MKIKSNCRYILWDRPCRFHKETGVECSSCIYFRSRLPNILIVKLDARGDVLRTTSILEGLKERYPDSFITWITMPESKELLINNPYIDRVISSDLDIMCALSQEKFDLVLNPDTSLLSSQLASRAVSKNKFGFGYRNNKVVPFNKESQYWYDIGMDDKLKKANKSTYQDILLDMFKLPKNKKNIILKLNEEELSFAEQFAQRNNLGDTETIIGFNTGAGTRWQYKSWSVDYTVNLIELIKEKVKAKVILFGGPSEKERNRLIVSRVQESVVDAGTGNSLREFVALVNLCNLMVVSDSLALHVAAALGKKVVALFGPTSSTEIELYGKGDKLVTPLSCKCCYKTRCDENPNCMETIEPQEVLTHIIHVLS